MDNKEEKNLALPVLHSLDFKAQLSSENSNIPKNQIMTCKDKSKESKFNSVQSIKDSVFDKKKSSMVIIASSSNSSDSVHDQKKNKMFSYVINSHSSDSVPNNKQSITSEFSYKFPSVSIFSSVQERKYYLPSVPVEELHIN